MAEASELLGIELVYLPRWKLPPKVFKIHPGQWTSYTATVRGELVEPRGAGGFPSRPVDKLRANGMRSIELVIRIPLLSV